MRKPQRNQKQAAIYVPGPLWLDLERSRYRQLRVRPTYFEDNAMTTADLLDTEKAASYLGCEASTLENWRCTKRHQIPYIKVGRLVKYRKDDLDAWIASRTVEVSRKELP